MKRNIDPGARLTGAPPSAGNNTISKKNVPVGATVFARVPAAVPASPQLQYMIHTLFVPQRQRRNVG